MGLWTQVASDPHGGTTAKRLAYSGSQIGELLHPFCFTSADVPLILFPIESGLP